MSTVAAAAVLPDDEGSGDGEARVHAVLDLHPEQLGGEHRSILTGYLTADSDPGPDYGKLTILTLPKQVNIPGPGSVENQFKTDPNVANELALLDAWRDHRSTSATC